MRLLNAMVVALPLVMVVQGGNDTHMFGQKKNNKRDFIKTVQTWEL